MNAMLIMSAGDIAHRVKQCMTVMMTAKSWWVHDSDDDSDGDILEREELVTGELKA